MISRTKYRKIRHSLYTARLITTSILLVVIIVLSGIVLAGWLV